MNLEEEEETNREVELKIAHSQPSIQSLYTFDCSGGAGGTALSGPIEDEWDLLNKIKVIK